MLRTCSLRCLLLPAVIPVILAGCSQQNEQADLWKNYDIYQGGAVDNDQYYVAPDCTIMDVPSCAID